MKKLILYIVLLSFVLTGCSYFKVDEQKAEETPDTEIDNVTTEAKPDYFGLAYYPNEAINPVLSQSKLNASFMKLIFEGLFELDSEFKPQNVLCESYNTADGLKYTFTIKSGVKFHSGAVLTAKDVAYTYNLAKNSQYSVYYSRMANIASVKAVSDNTLSIVLKTKNNKLPALLDIPIFRQGSESAAFSDGTGPYMPAEEGSKHILKQFVSYRQSMSPAYDKINFINTIRSDAVVYSFETGEVSMTQASRISSTPMSFRGAVEIKTIPSTDLHYLGVNCNKTPLTSQTVREALSLLLDRHEIVKNQLQECADAAVLPVNPQPKSMEGKLNLSKDNIKAMSLLAASDIKDTDGDGVLDYAGLNGKRHPFQPVILVNDDNMYKTAVLQRYVEDLKSVGIHASIKAVSFEAYQEALSKGEFDLYYGEIFMTPDFDLKPLIAQNGALNFGKFVNPEIEAALENANGASKETAELSETVLYNQLLTVMPIIPIAFTRVQVVSKQGLADGIAPTPYNIFHGIEKWTKKTEINGQ